MYAVEGVPGLTPTCGMSMRCSLLSSPLEAFETLATRVLDDARSLNGDVPAAVTFRLVQDCLSILCTGKWWGPTLDQVHLVNSHELRTAHTQQQRQVGNNSTREQLERGVSEFWLQTSPPLPHSVSDDAPAACMPLLGQFLDGLRGKLESVVARTAALDVTRLVHAFHEVQKSRHDDEHKASANRDLAAHISDDSAGLLIDLTAGAVEAKGAEEEGNREEADEADAGPQPLHRRNFQQLEESLRVLWGSMDLAHRAELHERIQRHVAGTHPEGGPRYLWPALLGSSS